MHSAAGSTRGDNVKRREPGDIIPGILAGAAMGVFVFLIVMPWYPLFLGDWIVLGAVVGGPLGYFLGNDFFVWFRDQFFKPS